MKAKLLSIFIVFCVSQSFSQNFGTVLGKVYNTNGITSLPFVSVQILNTNLGATTNENGVFQILNIPSGNYEVMFSFVGYQSQRKKITVVSGKETTINVTLKETSEGLDEVIVSAKSKARKLKETSLPVSVISMNQVQGTVTSVSDVLGRTAGVTIRSTGGVGSASRISIRGLEGKRIGIFIDEVPMDNQSDFISLNDIPVDMISQIEIYKGIVPARLGGSAMGGAVNIKIKEYPPKYLDVSYQRESFNNNVAQVMARRHLEDAGILIGVGGFYTYADNSYTMQPPELKGNLKGLKVQRNHDAFKKLVIGAGVEATKLWFDSAEIEGVFLTTDREIQGIDYDIKEAKTTSRAFVLKNMLNKNDFFIEGLDFDYSTRLAFTKINLIDTANTIHQWDGSVYNTISPYGGELGTTYGSNSNDDKIFFSNRTNFEYLINNSHTVNLNSVFNLANGYPNDPTRDLSFGRQSVFDSKMRSWVLGLNHDYRTENDAFLNSFSVKYYLYTMETKSAKLNNGTSEIVPISIDKTDFGVSEAIRYRFSPNFLGRLSASYDVRIPTESELLGNGYSVSPSEGLNPERSINVNAGFFYDKKRKFQAEINFFYMHLTDMIRLVKGPFDTQFQNFGKMRSLGTEVEVKSDIFPWLYGYINGTFQDLRDVREFSDNGVTANPTKDKRMPNIPYLMANAGLEFHKENLFGGEGQNTRFFVDASFIEEYFYDFEMTNGSQRIIPQSLTFNFNVEHSLFDKRVFVSGRIANLTNATVLSEFNRPLPGRSFGIKLRYIVK